MSVGSHPLEGDGTLINIYFYLWKKKINTLESGLGVKIPPTVVYEHNFPKGWYYWSEKKEEIERKVGKEIDTKAIFKEFSKKQRGAADLDVVACYLSKGEDSRGDEQTVVEYLDKDALHEFLTKRAKRDQGILQRFVAPNGKHNVTIQAIWSPHVTLVEKRQNIHPINDRRYDIFERTVTYEGPSHYSREAFVAPHIKYQIRNICKSFTEHFYTTEHINISRMVLYFKVDRNSDVWLLWSSSLRISDKVQLNLAPRFSSPRRSKTQQEAEDGLPPAPTQQIAEQNHMIDDDFVPYEEPTMGPIHDLYTSVPKWSDRRLKKYRRERDDTAAEEPMTARPVSADREPLPPVPLTARGFRPDTAPNAADDASSPKIGSKSSRHRDAIEAAKEAESLWPVHVSYVRSYKAVQPRYGGPRQKRLKNASPRRSNMDPQSALSSPAASVQRGIEPDHKKTRTNIKSATELWRIARKAYETKYTEVLYACDQLSEFIDSLCYAIYSHFLTKKVAFYFSMPPILIRFFGDAFFDRFQHTGVEKGDYDGEFIVHKPALSVVQLQAEFQQWKTEVSKPLLESEAVIFRDRVKQELERHRLYSKTQRNPVHEERTEVSQQPSNSNFSISLGASTSASDLSASRVSRNDDTSGDELADSKVTRRSSKSSRRSSSKASNSSKEPNTDAENTDKSGDSSSESD